MRSSQLLILAPLLVCLGTCIACDDIFFHSPKESIYLAGAVGQGGAYFLAGHGSNPRRNFRIYESSNVYCVAGIAESGDIITRSVAPTSHQLFYLTGNATGQASFHPHPYYSQTGFPNYLFNPTSDIFLASMTSSGSENWGIRIHGSGPSSGNAIVTDDSGDLYMAGYFSGTIDFDLAQNGPGVSSVGDEDAFLCKYDGSETLLWTETLGGTGTATFNALALGNKLVYAAGSFTGQLANCPPSILDQSSGMQHCLICYYTTDGVLAWTYTADGQGNDYINSIDADTYGNLYFAGVFENDIAFNIFTGREIHSSNGETDIFLGRFNVMGDLLWIRTWGGPLADEAFSIVLEPETGCVYVVGSFLGSVDFDPGINRDIIQNMVGSDSFISKFDSDGNRIWTKVEGSVENDSYRTVMINGAGNIVVGGSTMNNATCTIYTPDGSFET